MATHSVLWTADSTTLGIGDRRSESESESEWESEIEIGIGIGIGIGNGIGDRNRNRGAVIRVCVHDGLAVSLHQRQAPADPCQSHRSSAASCTSSTGFAPGREDVQKILLSDVFFTQDIANAVFTGICVFSHQLGGPQ